MRHQALQFDVFFLELLELARLTRLKPAVDLLPAAKRPVEHTTVYDLNGPLRLRYDVP
jgi:hypothetical protein